MFDVNIIRHGELWLWSSRGQNHKITSSMFIFFKENVNATGLIFYQTLPMKNACSPAKHFILATLICSAKKYRIPCIDRHFFLILCNVFAFLCLPSMPIHVTLYYLFTSKERINCDAQLLYYLRVI